MAAPLPQPLHHINAAVVNNKIYVVGALQGISFDPYRRTWEYDPGDDSWTEKNPMPAGTERGGSAIGVIDGTIYIAGGVRGRAVAEVSSYDPVLDEWDTSLPPLSGPSDHLAGAAVDGIFYAIGGRNGSVTAVLDRVEAFDPKTGQWTPRATMLTGRGGLAAGVVDGAIIVVGGEGNPNHPDGVFPQTESYDPVADEWTTLTPMLTPRHGMGAVGYDGKLWVPGGATRHYFAATSISEVFEP
jgi:N-acetylneuraminic acid mutarotase